MDRKYVEFDHDRTDLQNMHDLIINEVEEIFSFIPRSQSPFVYLMAMKNLVIVGRFTVSVRITNATYSLDKLRGCRQLDVALASNLDFHQSFVNINDFLEKIFQTFEDNDVILTFKEYE